MRAVGQTALGNVTFADVLLWVAPATLNGYTVRQFVETVLLIPDNELTFADLLAAFLAESSLGWERLNLGAANVNTIAAAAGTAHYAVEVELTPDTPAGLGATDSTVVDRHAAGRVRLRPRLVRARRSLDAGARRAPSADPTITGDELSWTLPLTVGPALPADVRRPSTVDARAGAGDRRGGSGGRAARRRVPRPPR